VSHDALDNLRTWTQPGEGQRRYDYDGSNRLTVVRNAGGAAIIGLGYDVQGNLSLKNGQGYQFDFGNRLRVATSLERYRYDGHGRRSSVIDAGSGKNRHYLYSQGGALAYLWDQGTGGRAQWIQLTVWWRAAYTLYGAGMGAAKAGVGYTSKVCQKYSADHGWEISAEIVHRDGGAIHISDIAASSSSRADD